MADTKLTQRIIGNLLDICSSFVVIQQLRCQNSFSNCRLTPVERQLIWEHGPGQELRENSAVLGILGLSVTIFMLSLTNPVMQWICAVSC